MRAASVSIPVGATTTIVTQAECPATIMLANVGNGAGSTGTAFVSNEGNAFTALSGIPISYGKRMVWGKTNGPLYAYAVDQASKLLVTFLDPDDEIEV